MPCYRMAIRFAAPAEEDQARSSMFVMLANVGGESEAKKTAVAACRDLALAAGFRFDQPVRDKDVSVAPVKMPADCRLELVALEVSTGVFCARLAGPLDGASALCFDRETRHWKSEGARLLCIDVNHAHPVGSAGLGVLLNVNDRLEVRLVRVPPAMRKMFDVLGIGEALPFFDGFPEALTAPHRHPA